MKINNQLQVISDPYNPQEVKVPTMPLLIVLDNGLIAEARTMRGAVACVVGREYFDAEDSIDEWHYRVEASRKEAMKAIMRDIYAVTYDERKGVIECNYAADPDDEDYEIETLDPPLKIRVENDRLFLLSLMEIGSIRVLEREDSFLLRPNRAWEEHGPMQCCNKCIYKEDINDEFICPVYNEKNNGNDGKSCSSFVIKDGNVKDAPGGSYIDIAVEYDLDELVSKVGQLWTIEK